MSDASPLAHLGPPHPPLLGTQHAYGIRGLRIQPGSLRDWSATLTRNGKSIARIVSKAGLVDVEFDDPQEDVAFLQAIQGRSLPSGLPATVENVALDLVLIKAAEESAELILTRDKDGTPDVFPRPEGELSEDVLALLAIQDVREVYQPGQGWCELHSTGTVLSSAPPLTLVEACEQAMRLHEIQPGDTLNLSTLHIQTMFELGGIARAILNLPEEPDTQGGAISLRFVVALLAALGSTLPPSRLEAEKVLQACLDRAFPGAAATLAHLSTPMEDACEHEDLLRAMVTVLPLSDMPAWADEPEQGEVQDDLLMAAVSIMRALHSVLHVDVNATLRDMLGNPQA